MLYNRKIKYLEYYEGGNKVNGGGFAKLEVRDNILRLELSIRGLRPTDSFERDIMLQGVEKEEALGQIRIQNGCGQFRYSCDADQKIGATGVSYSDLCGIRIPIGGTREILCRWDNVSDKRRITPPEENTQKSKSDIQESKRESITESYTDNKADSGEPVYTESDQSRDPELEITEKTEEKKQEAEKQEYESIIDKDTKGENREVTDRETQEAKNRKDTDREGQEGKEKREVKEDMKNDGEGEEDGEGDNKGSGNRVEGNNSEKQPDASKTPVKLMEDKWQQLSAIYPHIQPFRDERDYLSLTPSDFVLFPDRFYRAVNNSFLLHGYYNYHHLILARIERRGDILYYIGVPGNYFEREKQVAIMFGFESFECETEPAKTGDFGYYMMRTEL